MRNQKEWVIGGGIFLITLVLLETLFLILASTNVISISDGSFVKRRKFIYDPITGWRMRPDSRFGTIYLKPVDEAINKDGWRDDDYPVVKPQGSFRIAAMGDSFTFGFAVDKERSYPKALEQLFHKRGQPNVEVMNFGVCGWGLDQMLLGYQAYVRKYKPDVIILFYSSDIFLRTAYSEGWGAEKPFFVLNGQSLELKNSPVPENPYPVDRWLKDHSVLYRFITDKVMVLREGYKYRRHADSAKWVPRNEKARQLSVAILKLFKEQAEKDHMRLIVFVFDRTAPTLLKTCRDAGVEAFDIQDMLPEVDMKSDWREKSPLHFPPPIMHWNEKGNEFVAEGLYRYLKKKTVVPEPETADLGE